MQRYHRQCVQLGICARNALNLPKNAIKQPFEKMNLPNILSGLKGEIVELENELFNFNKERTHYTIKQNIDPERAISELSDCAGYLVGLLAWLFENIDSLKEKQEDL